MCPISVSIGPGWTELQRIPSFAYVLAIDLVIRRKAPLDAP